MADPSISIDDEPIIAAMRKHDVPFVLIGGHAVCRHGYRRSTEDIDVVWLRSDDTKAKLLLALTEINAVWISNEIDLNHVQRYNHFRDRDEIANVNFSRGGGNASAVRIRSD